MTTPYWARRRYVLAVILFVLAAVPMLVRTASVLLSNMGWVYLVRQSIPDAQNLFTSSNRLNPVNGSAMIGLCRVLEVQELTEMAVGCQRDVWTTGMTRLSELLLLGNLAHELGDSELALAAWRTAGAGSYFYGQAQRAAQAGDTDKALSLNRTAIEIDPKLAQAYLDVGKLHFEVRDFERAYKAFKARVELTPDREGYAWLGRTLELLGQTNAALDAYGQAARQGELWYGYLAAGDLQRKSGNLNEAEAWYLRAQISFPETASVLVRLGDVALTRKDFSKANDYFRAALLQSPTDPDAFYAMARLSSALGADQDVLLWTEQALERGLRTDFWFHKMRGRAYNNTGECALASRSYRAALSSPDMPASEKSFLVGQLEAIERDCREVQ